MHGAAGKARSKSLHPELTIHNTSVAPVVVTGGQLSTSEGVFNSTPPGLETLSSRTVAAGETKRISLPFRFDRPIQDVLVEPLTLTVSLKTSAGPREVRIALQKN